MGIRPQAYLICGITDLKTNKEGDITDPRYHPRTDWVEPDLQHPWDEETVPLPSIADVDKTRFSEADYWADVQTRLSILNNLARIEPGRTPGENRWPVPKTGDEVIMHDGEFGMGNIIGFIHQKLTGQGMLYTLSAVYPELRENHFQLIPNLGINEDYEARPLQDMLEELGTWDAVEADLTRRMAEPLSQILARQLLDKMRAIKNGQNPYMYNQDMPGLIATTAWLFDWIGLKVDPAEFRLFFYWKWS